MKHKNTTAPGYTHGVAILLLFLFSSLGAAAGEAGFGSCYARWTDTGLTIGNSHIERTWQISGGLLKATSFRDKTANVEWIRKPADHPAPIPGGVVPGETRAVTISAKSGRMGVTEEDSLVVEMTAAGKRSFSYKFQIFPEARGVGIFFHGGDLPQSGDKPVSGGNRKSAADTTTGVESAPAKKNDRPHGDSLEELLLAPQHLLFTQVTLQDRTDVHNEVVFENEWLIRTDRAIEVQGNIFFVENPESGTGLIFIKFAPLPHARPLKSEWDARMNGTLRELRFAGQGYPFTLLAYSGGRAGRIETLQSYQRQLRRFVPGRDGLFLSNTWGDRSRDARLNETFMLKEIEAGARLGVEVTQIDDGWQKGVSANSSRTTASQKGTWADYWDKNPDFWDVDTSRFPNGLAPLVEKARANGMKLGLWFSPDSTNSGAYWERDAEYVLKLHREHHIDDYKIDGIHLTTYQGWENLRRFFNKILLDSDGKIVCDLDATAGLRPSYLGLPEVGPIFVENRYTDFHNYWPHMTLRSLWELSQYVDPVRMRMEFLNNTRNTDKYKGDSLAPANYTPDALFATVMLSNPLGWFEVSNLPGDYFRLAGPLIKKWKEERTRMFTNTIVPIGAAPDGIAWTGFVSVSKDRRSGYVLAFRELNQTSEWSVELPLFSGARRVTVLAGNGAAELSGNKLTVRILEKLQYLWLRVE